jgi:MerR family copper efflux transcriptional regulator
MQGDNGERSMQIGEVAERTGLSYRTLRHYDEVGLLSPSARSDGGFRLYTEVDVEKLLVIRRMKPLGYSLDEMLNVMRTIEGQHDSGTENPLGPMIIEAQERRDRLRLHLRMADEFIELLTQRAVGFPGE